MTNNREKLEAWAKWKEGNDSPCTVLRFLVWQCSSCPLFIPFGCSPDNRQYRHDKAICLLTEMDKEEEYGQANRISNAVRV
jgi:hypothetical protein